MIQEIYPVWTPLVTMYSVPLPLQNLVGAVGEQVAYFHLQRRFYGQQDVVVEWVNKQKETGKPYNALVKEKTINPEVFNDIEYVEVKATLNLDPQNMVLSRCEWEQAIRERGKFVIYRVCAVPRQAVGKYMSFRIIQIRDPVGLVDQGVLKRVVND